MVWDTPAHLVSAATSVGGEDLTQLEDGTSVDFVRDRLAMVQFGSGSGPF